MPKELIQPSQLEDLKKQRKPAFTPVSPETDATKLHDEETGITQRRLANGIPVNYKVYYVCIEFLMLLAHYFPLLHHCTPFIARRCLLFTIKLFRNCDSVFMDS